MTHFQENEILAAQRAWGDSLIDVGSVFSQGGDHVARAKELLASLYAYHVGPVIFKPTLAASKQFRNTVEGALSYFVGGNADYPEDSGFAVKPWTAVRFENEGMVCQSDSAFAMGNYFFTDTQGQETKVEYSFAYRRGPDGEVLINLHHSSLPYSPPA